MPIERVDESIVTELRAAWEIYDSLPLRPAVDLITRDAEGQRWAPARLVEDLLHTFEMQGIEAEESRTYRLHPNAQAARHANRFPDRTLGIEVRRDLLVERFHLLEAMSVVAEQVDRYASPIAAALNRWLKGSQPPLAAPRPRSL